MNDVDPNIRNLAQNYRYLVLWFGGNLIAGLASLVLQANAPDSLILLLALANLVTWIALIVYGYKTSQALQSHVPWLWALAMCIPCLNLIILLVLSAKATRACRDQGVPVGFLGPQVPP